MHTYAYIPTYLHMHIYIHRDATFEGLGKGPAEALRLEFTTLDKEKFRVREGARESRALAVRFSLL